MLTRNCFNRISAVVDPIAKKKRILSFVMFDRRRFCSPFVFEKRWNCGFYLEFDKIALINTNTSAFIQPQFCFVNCFFFNNKKCFLIPFNTFCVLLVFIKILLGMYRINKISRKLHRINSLQNRILHHHCFHWPQFYRKILERPGSRFCDVLWKIQDEFFHF